MGRKKGTHSRCSNGTKWGSGRFTRGLDIWARVDEIECTFIHLLKCSRKGREEEKEEWENTIKERENEEERKITEKKEKNEIKTSFSSLFS